MPKLSKTSLVSIS